MDHEELQQKHAGDTRPLGIPDRRATAEGAASEAELPMKPAGRVASWLTAQDRTVLLREGSAAILDCQPSPAATLFLSIQHAGIARG